MNCFYNYNKCRLLEIPFRFLIYGYERAAGLLIVGCISIASTIVPIPIQAASRVDVSKYCNFSLTIPERLKDPDSHYWSFGRRCNRNRDTARQDEEVLSISDNTKNQTDIFTVRHSKIRYANRKSHPNIIQPVPLYTSRLASNLPQKASLGLKIENAGTDKTYISYNGQPVFSFGTSNDVDLGRPRISNFDIIAWAEWQRAHGMNHLRHVFTQSFGSLDLWAEESGQQPLYHFVRAENGKFDLDKFDSRLWQRIRAQVKGLYERGIIIQISLFNGLSLAGIKLIGGHDIFWGSNYWNPINNINEYTMSLESCDKHDDVCPFVDEAVKLASRGDARLLDSQKRWVRQILDHTAIFGNVYIDIAHELGVRDVDKKLAGPYVRSWIDNMIDEVRAWESEHSVKVILGMDATYLDKEWILQHSGLDILLWGYPHAHNKVLGWRERYKKPYVPDESWPPTGKVRYKYPRDHGLIRRYVWRMLVDKVQFCNIYLNTNSYQGLGKFEDYAGIIRYFWDTIEDYPNMVPVDGKILGGDDFDAHMMESPKEVIIYLEPGNAGWIHLLPTRVQRWLGADVGPTYGKRYNARELRLRNLTMSDASVEVRILHPVTGEATLSIGTVVEGAITIHLPSFRDDIVAHIKVLSMTPLNN